MGKFPFKKETVLLAPVRDLTKKKVECIIDLKTEETLREALKIHFRNSSKIYFTYVNRDQVIASKQ